MKLKLFQLPEDIQSLLTVQVALGKEVLSLPEAARYLNISKQKLYQMTSERTIAFSKPCERIFFKRDVLDEWAMSNPIRTMEEIGAEAKAKTKNKK